MKDIIKNTGAILIAALIFMTSMPTGAHEGHDDIGLTSQFIVVRGELEVLSFDDFAGKKSVKIYYLIDSATGKKYELHFKNQVPVGFAKRQMAKIRGQLFTEKDIMVNVKDLELAALDGNTSSSTATLGAIIPRVAGTRKTLVLSIASNDYTPKCSLDTLNNLFFNDTAKSVNYMYQDASKGILSLAGESYNVNINVSTAGVPCDTNYSTWSSLAIQSAQAAGITTTGYDNYVYILPSSSCGWAGLGSLGYGRAWIAGNYCGHGDVSAHELGHNFGMHHARSGGAEYGDTSDIMGYGGVGLRTLNGAHMDFMGWLPSTHLISGTVGTYEVAAIESDPHLVGLPLLVKFPNPVTGGSFYFSFRQRLGYDSKYLPSTYIDKLSVHSNSGAYSDLLAVLGPDQSYLNVATGMNIKVNSINLTSTPPIVNFTISGQCVANAPSLSISPSIQSAAFGQTKSYMVTITNRDGVFCDSTQFNLSALLPAELSASVATKMISLAPGASGTVSFEITSTTTAPSAAYILTIQSGDQNRNTTHVASATAQYVLDSTPPSLPTGLKLISSKGKTIKFSWTASTDNIAVTKYYIVRNGVLTGTSTSNSFNDTVGRGTFNYQVIAEDGAGNKSGISTEILTVKK